MNSLPTPPASHRLPDYLHTGIVAMDEQHAALFELILRLKAGLSARGVADEAVRRHLSQLQEAIATHFATEENLAYTGGLDFTEHRLEHERLQLTFQRYLNELLQGHTNVPAFLVFLDHWFENHIVQMDISFGRQLEGM